MFDNESEADKKTAKETKDAKELADKQEKDAKELTAKKEKALEKHAKGPKTSSTIHTA